eukprot:TRINITY_DN1311_c0_g1_i2.p2 TRINITY_DN1311_c0_g1~~TRINITY_DN1311_c0_g1_i2.p2  ORF type:complete len:159 (+),score=64.44 TRINITY_DN1311_c0_g1_i2:103-579(+)
MRPKSRRGGRRARKQKGMTAMSELEKLSGRLSFGVEAEETYGYLDEEAGLGMIGKGLGKIRYSSNDKKSALNKNKKRKVETSSGQSTVSGLASSIAFTTVQGMELMNPELKKQLQRKKGKPSFFSDNAGFKTPQSTLPRHSSSSSSSSSSKSSNKTEK